MKTAIYPGSFNPIHEGHMSVIRQALDVFDKVIVAVGTNPDKPTEDLEGRVKLIIRDLNAELGEPVGDPNDIIEVVHFQGLLRDFIEERTEIDAIVKGLRNPNDFIYEQQMQYINDELGVVIPSFYIIAERGLVHVSSSAIRQIRKLTKAGDDKTTKG